MVTLFLISQWLHLLFRWANASASDFYINSPPLLQVYMLQPDQLLHTECEEEREALFLFFDGRSSVTTPIDDESAECSNSANAVFWGSFWSLVIAATCKARCECTIRTLLLFTGVEQKPHVQTKLDNLLVLQSLFKYRKFLRFSESLKQSCLNFPLSGFYTGVTVNLTQDDVVVNSVVKSVTEHWRKEHDEGWTVCHDLIHFRSGRQNSRVSFFG